MNTLELLKNIGTRTNNDIYVGVVGPVRVGKSTFIRKFMELVVIDNIEDEDEKRRTIDELPQAGLGKQIMTCEPKFVPNNATKVQVDEQLFVNIRLVDCVGYVFEDALGYKEGETVRMVKTPWFDEPIAFDEAARVGTNKVINDHSTIGVVVTTDGSIVDIDRNFLDKNGASRYQNIYVELPDFDKFYEEYLRKSYTIGGEIIFPKYPKSINVERGRYNGIIKDRFDLTLECIRKYMIAKLKQWLMMF